VRVPQHGLRVRAGVGAVPDHPGADDPGLPRVQEPGVLRGSQGVTTLQTPRPTETAVHPQPSIAAAGAVATRARNRYRTTQSAHWQKIIAYSILVFGSIAFLIPFYFVVNGSLKTEAEVQAGDFIRLPRSTDLIQWKNYPRALSKEKM